MQLAATVVVHVYVLAGEFIFAQTSIDHVVDLAHPLGELFLRVDLHDIGFTLSDTDGMHGDTLGGDWANISRMCAEHWAQG